MSEESKELTVAESPKTVTPEIKKYIQSSLYQLVKASPFIGGLIQELSLTITTAMPTAYIGFDKRTMKFVMGINPDFFMKCTPDQRVGVLTHEILHFVHQHLMRGGFDTGHHSEKVLWNIAGDMAINQYIEHLPEGGVNIDQWKQPDGKDLEKFKPMEYYFEQIKQSLQQQQKGKGKKQEGDQDGEQQDGDQQGEGQDGEGNQPGGSGGMPKWLKDFHDRKDSQPKDEKGQTKWGKGKQSNDEAFDKFKPFDEHDWDSLNPEEREKMLKEAKDLVQRTIEKSSHGHSLVPKELKELLQSLDAQIQKLDYKGILKRAIKKSVTVSDRLGTWHRPNKRYGSYSQGTTVGKLPQINVYIDTSGSMSIREINESINLMSGFMKVGNKQCNLGLWHTNLYHFKKHKLNKPIEEDAFQSGGTDPDPVLEHIKKNKPNLSIIITDGFYSQSSIELKEDVVWCIRDDNNVDHPNKHIGKTVKYNALK